MPFKNSCRVLCPGWDQCEKQEDNLCDFTTTDCEMEDGQFKCFCKEGFHNLSLEYRCEGYCVIFAGITTAGKTKTSPKKSVKKCNMYSIIENKYNFSIKNSVSCSPIQSTTKVVRNLGWLPCKTI